MFGTLAGFRAYHADRGNLGPTQASDGDASAALFRGSDFIRRAFEICAPDDDPRVVEAAYVAAGYEIDANGALLATPGYWTAADKGKVLTKVDSIQWTVTGEGSGSAGDKLTARGALAGILRGALCGGSGVGLGFRAIGS